MKSLPYYILALILNFSCIFAPLTMAGKIRQDNKKSERVIRLCEKADSCLTINKADEALVYVEEGSKILGRSKHYKYIRIKLRFYEALCYAHLTPPDFNKAEHCFMSLRKKNPSFDHLIGLELGKMYLDMQQFSDAVTVLEDCLTAVPSSHRDIDWEAEVSSFLAMAYIGNNQKDKASELLNELVDYYKNSLSEEKYIGLMSSLNDAFIRDGQGNIIWHDKVGIRIVEELVNYADSREDWERYVPLEHELGFLYQVQGDFRNSYLSFSNAIDHYITSNSHPFLSELYLGAAAAVSRNGNFDLSNELLNKAEIAIENEGDDSWKEFQRKSILNSKAIRYIDHGVNTEEAIRILLDLLSSAPEYEIATLLYNLGQAYENLGDYVQAYYKYKEALASYEKEGHGILYAKALNKVGYCVYREGDYVAANKYFDLSIDIFRRLSSANNFSYIVALGYASACAYSLREYGRAIAFAEESRSLQHSMGSVSSEVAWEVLLDCYDAIKDDEHYYEIYAEYKDIHKGDVGYEIRFLIDDSKALFDAGDVEGGINLFNTAQESWRSLPEGSDKNYLKEYISAGQSLFFPNKDSLSMFSFYSELLSQRDSLSRQDKYSLSRLANNYCNKRAYASANTLFQLTTPVWTNNLEMLHSSYLSAINCKDYEFCNIIATYIKRNIQSQMKSIIGLSDAEKEVYWNSILKIKSLVFSSIYDSFDTGILCDISLLCKSFLLRSNIAFFNLIAEQGDKNMMLEIKDFRQIVNIINSGNHLYSPEVLDSLRIREIELRQSMISRVKDYPNSDLFFQKTWKDVRQFLKSNEIAIEIDDFPIPDNDRQYIAFVIDKKFSSPYLIYLCRDSDLNSLLSKKPQELYDKNLPFSHQLYSLLLEKLMPFLADKESVYLSSSGRISTIAIEAITCPNNKYFSETFTIKRITSTEAMYDSFDIKSISSASIFGGIRYDDNQKDIERTQALYNNVEADYLFDRSVTEIIDYLPGTRKEANIVLKVLTDQQIESKSFFGYEATEEEFKALSGTNNSIIHIATHGFYKPVEKTRRTGFFQDEATSNDIPPMRRSGLLMAGSNDAWNGIFDHNKEDGVLTAAEISGLDLSQTQLVVLSACETGLGEVTEDGIAGLQRAFKNSGARTIVMSLWRVDDNATAILMENFYTQLAKGKEIRDAFRIAKDRVMQKTKYSNPYYWAGFIMLD